MLPYGKDAAVVKDWPPQMRGVLQKMSPSPFRLGHYQQRFVCVAQGRLHWWNTEMDADAQGFETCKGILDFALNPCEIGDENGSPTKFWIRPSGGKWKNGNFTGSDGGRVFHFDAAGSASDRAAWIESLKAHAARAQEDGVEYSKGLEGFRGAVSLVGAKEDMGLAIEDECADTGAKEAAVTRNAAGCSEEVATANASQDRVGHERLVGKVAIVTGSSKGIGQAIAIRFAQEGAKVVVNYCSDPKGAEQTCTECRKVGGEGCCVSVQADLGKVADCRELAQKAMQRFGSIDILVNNAGKEIHDEVWDVKESDYDRVMDINMKGVFFCTQAVVQEMVREKKQGAIVNVSSVHEDLPFPGFSPYCMSKGAMKMFTRNLSIELAPYGITINNIAPGAIETPINASVLKEPTKLIALLENIPLNRLGSPSDIASCALYLASDDASYCTGSTIVVDGGLTWNYVEHH